MRFRLTTTAKVLILVVILALVGGLAYAGVRSGLIKNDTADTVQKVKDKFSKGVSDKQAAEYADGDEDAVINMGKESEDTINLSLDEWPG